MTEIQKEEKDISTKPETFMGKLVNTSETPSSLGDLVEGDVIAITKNAIYISLPAARTGIIYGREFINARDIIRKVHIGDSVAGKVVDINNEDGYTEISLREARQALIWAEAEEAIGSKTVFELAITDANKGGLIINWQGIQGFLPASQLKSEHYPRVEDGDKDKILEELKNLIGQKLSVSVIAALPQEGKLIFSEKDLNDEDKEKIIGKYALGDIIEGEITGMVDFGVFIKIENNLEGLVHISEIDWALVENPRLLFNIGDKVKAKIIEIKDKKISLSIKALKENPWATAQKKYKQGDAVDGVVIKFNKHGALVSIEEGVAGLVHVSEFGDEEKLRQELELGKTYKFTISLFEAGDQKMTLTPIK
jgi:small subunit ribosomal protein S1